MCAIRSLEALAPGRLVRVYRNLHYVAPDGGPVYSVQDARTRRVIARVERVTLADVTMSVSAAGRDRVRRERRKNVHAFAAGTVDVLCVDLPETLQYDPYVHDGFTDPRTGLVVTHAKAVTLDHTGVRYLPR